MYNDVELYKRLTQLNIVVSDVLDKIYEQYTPQVLSLVKLFLLQGESV